MTTICPKVLFFTVIFVTVACTAKAGGFLDDVGKAVNKAATDTGKAIEKGTQDTGKAVEKGTQDTGKAIEKGTQDTGKAIEKGTQDTGKAIEKGTQDAGKAIEKAAHDIGNALTVHPNNGAPDYKAYFVLLEARCPSSDNDTTWRSYLSNPTPGRQYSAVGVQFRYAKTFGDKLGLDGLDPSACYTITFGPGQGFGSHRSFSYSRMNNPEYDDIHLKSNLPGDPNSYDLNVDGVLLRYNEAGEIYDHKGRISGTMVCYLSNDCQQFSY